MNKNCFYTIIQFAYIRPKSFGYKGQYQFEDETQNEVLSLQIDDCFCYIDKNTDNMRYVTHTVGQPRICQVPPKNTPIKLLRLYIKHIKNNYTALTSPTFFDCRCARILTKTQTDSGEIISWERFAIRFLDEFYIVNSSGDCEKIFNMDIQVLEIFKRDTLPQSCHYLKKTFDLMSEESDAHKPLLDHYKRLYAVLPKLEKRIHRHEKKVVRITQRRIKKGRKTSLSISSGILDFLIVMLAFAFIMIFVSIFT